MALQCTYAKKVRIPVLFSSLPQHRVYKTERAHLSADLSCVTWPMTRWVPSPLSTRFWSRDRAARSGDRSCERSARVLSASTVPPPPGLTVYGVFVFTYAKLTLGTVPTGVRRTLSAGLTSLGWPLLTLQTPSLWKVRVSSKLQSLYCDIFTKSLNLSKNLCLFPQNFMIYLQMWQVSSMYKVSTMFQV